MKIVSGAICASLLSLFASNAMAFCGFYVAKADTNIYNSASQVVLVRDDNRTVITMGNDFQGDVRDFAMVIPVPTFIEREQINVANQALIDHLDAYTAPRLVEYFDDNPCMQRRTLAMTSASSPVRRSITKTKDSGVTIEASYTVGEYDILILAAEQSTGLIDWLKQNGYRLPDGAEQVVGSYIKQDMRFFVAKINLDEHESLGFSKLRPLQVAFESPKFMLPIRLGTLNAKGQQELFVYTLTRTGRVETSNYRTVRLPTDVDIPIAVKPRFNDFYRDMFTRQVEKHEGRAVFLEYAWDMAWCDPCAADPLSTTQLRNLGVYWLDEESAAVQPPGQVRPQGQIQRQTQAQNVFVTRLHLRYDAERFPDDLKFIETGDRSNFQGRYVMRHAWKGTADCAAANGYYAKVKRRKSKEAVRLASLTGWDKAEIRTLIGDSVQLPSDDKWWKNIWSK